MKRRNPEAVRLEADYIGRLRSALAGRNPAEAADIVGSVQEHIEEALAEFGEGEVTLVQMAGVLERLGPPESCAAEETGAQQAPPAHEAHMPAAAAPASGPSAIGCAEREEFASFLEKVWWGYLVAVLGFYVPLIDFHFCDLAGAAILAYVLLNHRGLRSESFNFAGKLAVASAILIVVDVPLSILELVHPAFALLGLPVVVSGAVCGLILYWKVLDGTASVLQRTGNAGLAGYVRDIRIYYVVALVGLFALGLIIGAVAVFGAGVRHAAVELWWIGLPLLPVGWLVGWFFMLRPLGMAREALRRGTGKSEGGYVEYPA